jgi:hypothetical protein
MPKGEREERAPRPERSHPINEALYKLGRDFFTPYYNFCLSAGANPDPALKAAMKAQLIAKIDAAKEMVEAS